VPLFRRKREEERDVSNVLYVHLARDGGIFAVRGDTGAQAWIPRWRLEEELERIKAANGTILLSWEETGGEPPRIVQETFDLIKASGIPLKETTEPHPDAKMEGGATALMAAAYGGGDDVLSDLIQRGAELETKDVDGYTALMYAANGGQLRTLELLLDAGADVNARDKENSTPIMFAAQHGHGEIVRVLAEHGADLDARGEHGLTALGFARQNGHEEVARVLEEAGAGV
jgi:Ankyrin repeats (many copies)/Ankyrin repeat